MSTEEIALIKDNIVVVLETVSEVAYTDTSDIPQHKTSAQYAVSDHVIQNPVSATLKMTVYKDDLDTLLKLKHQKKKMKLISETRVIESVVITALNYTEGLAINTCSVTMKLQEIIVAKIESASESLDLLKTKPEASVTASSSRSLENYTFPGEDIVEIGDYVYTIEGLAG